MFAPKYGTFNVIPRPIPESDFKKVLQPYETYKLGCFSVKPNGCFEDSFKNLRFLLKTTLDLPRSLNIENKDDDDDINKDVDEVIKNDDDLDYILNFICQSEEIFLTKTPGEYVGGGLDRDFVCTRDVLELLMCTPYEQTREWKLHISQYKGTIFISQKRTSMELEMKRLGEPWYPQQTIKEQWEKELRRFCLRKESTEKEIHYWHVPGDEVCVQFICVFEAILDGLKIMFNAEMHGCLPLKKSEDLSELEFLLFKPKKTLMEEHEKRVYQNCDSLHWWCQCYLMNLDSLYIAHCTSTGLEHTIKQTNLSDLAEEMKSHWNPLVCVNFLVRFLRGLKMFFGRMDDPDKIFEFNYHPMFNSISYQRYENKTLIPKWYREMMDEPQD